MMWMPMPGQTWLAAGASFLGMWVAMTAAMMLPSSLPMLWRYRRAVASTGRTRLAVPTALVGAAYLFVWTALGALVFPLGAASSVMMRRPPLAHAAPVVTGAVVLIAGAYQLTAWKAHHLACCRSVFARAGALPVNAGTAWRHGVRLGLHCVRCCGNLMAVSLVIGVMDLRAMAVVGAAVALERLAPAGARVARATGAVVIAVGMLLLARPA
jgi:predicted metal-binding membrane protein